MASSVISGVATAISARRVDCRTRSIRNPPAIITRAGGRTKSNMLVVLPDVLGYRPGVVSVVIVGTLEHKAEQFGAHHHGHAGDKAVDRVEAEPAVDLEVCVEVNTQLAGDRQRQNGAKNPPHQAD